MVNNSNRLMTTEELNQYIINILPEIQKDWANGVYFTSQEYFREHNIDWNDADYIIAKLEEFNLIQRSPKYKSELGLTTFGQEVIRDGGWHVYLEHEMARRQRALELQEAEAAAEKARMDEELELNRIATKAAADSAKSAEKANTIAARANILSARANRIAIVASVIAVGSVGYTIWDSIHKGKDNDEQKTEMVVLHSSLDSLKTALAARDSVQKHPSDLDLQQDVKHKDDRALKRKH